MKRMWYQRSEGREVFPAIWPRQVRQSRLPLTWLALKLATKHHDRHLPLLGPSRPSSKFCVAFPLRERKRGPWKISIQTRGQDRQARTHLQRFCPFRRVESLFFPSILFLSTRSYQRVLFNLVDSSRTAIICCFQKKFPPFSSLLDQP